MTFVLNIKRESIIINAQASVERFTYVNFSMSHQRCFHVLGNSESFPTDTLQLDEMSVEMISQKEHRYGYSSSTYLTIILKLM